MATLVVVNHLRLRDPLIDATVEAAHEGMRMVVGAGALAARMAKVDETHLILILEFATAEDAGRIARDVGGPWMNAHIRPLLAGDTERSVGGVIASAEACFATWRLSRGAGDHPPLAPAVVGCMNTVPLVDVPPCVPTAVR